MTGTKNLSLMNDHWLLLPPWVWTDPELSPTEKMLVGRVWALAKRTGYCYASNETLGQGLGCADRPDMSDRQVRAALSKAELRGHIERQGRGTGRRVYPKQPQRLPDETAENRRFSQDGIPPGGRIGGKPPKESAENRRVVTTKGEGTDDASLASLASHHPGKPDVESSVENLEAEQHPKPPPHPNGAGPPDEPTADDLLSAGKGAIAAEFMPAVRKRVYGEDGKPPSGYSEGRDISILEGWLKAGLGPQEIHDRLRGYYLLRESGALDRLGVGPGETATLRIMNRSDERGIPLSRRCEHVARTATPRKRERKSAGPSRIRVRLE